MRRLRHLYGVPRVRTRGARMIELFYALLVAMALYIGVMVRES